MGDHTEDVKTLFNFEEVRAQELDLIAAVHESQAGAPIDREALAQSLIGLALSGGGIRSASFNLGVIQALAKHRLLQHIDYLSTVSGGGYIGGWLSSWISRERERIKRQTAPDDKSSTSPATEFEYLAQATAHVIDALAQRDKAHDKNKPGNPFTRATEPEPISRIRRDANYLTPKLGLLSADFWTAIATHTRNTLLNLCILLPAIAGVVGLPWLILLLSDVAFHQVSAGLLAVLAVTIAFKGLYDFQRQQGDLKSNDSAVSRRLGFLVILPCWIGALALLKAPSSIFKHGAQGFAAVSAPYFAEWAVWLIAGGIGLGTSAAVLQGLARWRRVRSAKDIKVVEKRGPSVLRWVASALIGGALLGYFLWLTQQLLQIDTPAHLLPRTAGLGTVLVFVSLILGIVVQIGVLGGDLPESIREWWSRAGAWCWILGGAWLVIFLVCFVAPPLLLRAGTALTSSLSVGWLGTSLAGVLLGKSSLTGGEGSSKSLEKIVAVVPYVFVFGVLVAAATFNHWLIFADWNTCVWSVWSCRLVDSAGHLPRFAGAWTNGLASPNDFAPILSMLGVYVFLAWFMSKRLDINVFSFHAFYRNRLARCFLGATRSDTRHPDGFSGFDFLDDLSLVAMPQRPFHLINVALNLTRTDNPAWQERMAASFTFSRLHSGFQLPDDAKGRFRATHTFAKRDRDASRETLSLATAMTISGAAASPNSGHHTSPVLAFLMTIFNVRLGYWLANPSKDSAWAQGTPQHAGAFLLAELIGKADASSDFVYLSDGGHFENLGIYELVRRRCRFIIASDAGCDPNYEFEDLGNVIRKCRIDFGIEIDLKVSSIRPDSTSDSSKAHCVVGEIKYRDRDKETPNGYLLYIKSSLTGNETEDLKQYRASHATFPHESTADQWFSESQFESYRKLGFEITNGIFTEASAMKRREDIEKILLQIRDYWLPASPVTGESFSYHGDALQKIAQEIQSSDELTFLDVQVVPEWPYLMLRGQAAETPSDQLWLPKTPPQLRAGYYLCTRVIQLMENVYIDLRLEDFHSHPDNRGWMNLFRHWSWSGMFRATWAISVSTYGARFQEFCRKHLDLDFSPMQVSRVFTFTHPTHLGRDYGALVCAMLPTLAKCTTLNFAEHQKILMLVSKLPAVGVYYAKIEVIGINLPIGIEEINDAEIDFPIAYLLTYYDLFGNCLVADFRVRDHLRRMGLARRALSRVAEIRPDIGAPPLEILEALHDEEGARFAREFNSIFKLGKGAA